jgi:hypothetical protein
MALHELVRKLFLGPRLGKAGRRVGIGPFWRRRESEPYPAICRLRTKFTIFTLITISRFWFSTSQND